MHVFNELVESRIQEAIQRGDFDDLPNAGKAIALEPDPFVPEEMRMAYKILKNAGYLPPEIELRNNIAEMGNYLISEMDDKTRKQTLKKLQCLFMRLDESRQRQTNLLIQQEYYQKVIKRLAGI